MEVGDGGQLHHLPMHIGGLGTQESLAHWPLTSNSAHLHSLCCQANMGFVLLPCPTSTDHGVFQLFLFQPSVSRLDQVRVKDTRAKLADAGAE